MNIFKAIVNTAIKLPLSVVKDAVTFGGVLVDEEEPQTLTTLKEINDNLFKRRK